MLLFKLTVLILGILWVPLGSLLMALDAHFHFTSDLEQLQKESPDWIIMKYFFDMDGFGVMVHRLIAVLLFVSTVFYIYFISEKKKNLLVEWYPLFSKIVLSIITTGIVVKEWIHGEKGVAFT